MLRSLVARVFARGQHDQVRAGDLLEGVNTGLVEGEKAFDESEFRQGLADLERKNKIMVAEEGDLVLLIT